MATPMRGPARGENTYIMDAENATEMARLMNQDRMVNEGMGGLFPERGHELSDIHTILDIACGPGGWVLEVAHKYPKVQVIGIDRSNAVIEYARAQAWAQGLDNVRFKVMDAFKPLDFPDASLDLVNARFITMFMPTFRWPAFLKECLRVTRPNGVVRLIEGELSITSSSAFEQLTAMLGRALYLRGHSFSPDGRHLGITPVLGHMLREAGWTDIHKDVYLIDFSAGMSAHSDFYQNVMVGFQLLQPFLIESGLTTQEDVGRLYQQAMAEMLLEDFCGIWFYLCAWAVKP